MTPDDSKEEAADYKSLLETAKSLDWSSATARLFIVQKHKNDVLEVMSDNSILERIKEAGADILAKATALIPYDYQTEIPDRNHLFGIPLKDSDILLYSIESVRGAEKDLDFVNDIRQLINSLYYITMLEIQDGEHTPLFLCRRTSNRWTEKKSIFDVMGFFKNNKMQDVNQDNVFVFDKKIDFFVYKNEIFVADFTEFEAAVKYKERMLTRCNETLEAIGTYAIVDDIGKLSEFVGEMISRLKFVGKIGSASHFANEEFVASLKQRIKDKEYPSISLDDKEQLIVTKDNAELILRLLNDDHLSSKINKNTEYLASSKKPFAQ